VPRHVRPRLIVVGSIAGLFVWLFFDAIFSSGMFCFRDAAHYYYPFFKFIQSEWAAGRVPLWNPYENLGVPLAANPTASVFYPGKLVFALPLEYGSAYKLYIMGHLLLAALAAYALARHWKASIRAAGVCAMSYAFSGNVLMLYSNVVFLVGAAWLPAAVLATDRMLVERSPGWAVTLGAVLGLMVLGGDPQMAYNAGLLAAAYALWLWWLASPLSIWERLFKGSLSLWERVRVRALTLRRTRVPQNDDPCDHPHPGTVPKGERSWTRSPLVLLTVTAIAGLALSAVQVLPSLEFVARTDRAASRTARSLYEIPACLRGEGDDAWASIRDGLLCRQLEPETHHEHVYHFSVGPWRLAEYVWPNVSGRQFPVHHRWLEVIPAERRIWTPSLYMGLLPLILAVSAMRWRLTGRRSKNISDPFLLPFLSWVVLVAVVGSFGWFGLCWLAGEIRFAAGGDPSVLAGVGPPVGGLYWFMTVLLPGYIEFRYPAKLLVLAALGLSVLAARGWDRAFAGPSDRLRHWLLGLGMASLLGAVAALAIRPFWAGWLAGVEPDVLFGPLDTAGAANDLLASFVQTALVCGAAWWLFRRAARGARWTETVAVVLVAVDLAVANRWMVVSAPASQRPPESRMAVAIEREETHHGGDQLVRVFRHPIWIPPAWKRTSSPDRLVEAMRWDRDTLWPKYNLAGRLAITEVHGAMMLDDYRRFLSSFGRAELPSKVGAKYLVLPAGKTPSGGRKIETCLEDACLWAQEKGSELFSTPENSSDPFSDPFSARIVHYDPLRIEVEAELDRPGLVVLREQFYPGWQLEVETAGQGSGRVPIVRADHVMRGARLPAGQHRVIYRYRPASFLCGAIVSGTAWLGLAVVGAMFGARRYLQGRVPSAVKRN